MNTDDIIYDKIMVSSLRSDVYDLYVEKVVHFNCIWNRSKHKTHQTSQRAFSQKNIAVRTSNFNHRILYFRLTQNMYDNVEDHIIVKTHNNENLVMFLKQSFSS